MIPLDKYAIGLELYDRIRRNSIPSAGASPAMAFVKRCGSSALSSTFKSVRWPRGTAVFDWTIPKEWNIRDAYIKNRAGERVVDFHASNLHVVNYSVPGNGRN